MRSLLAEDKNRVYTDIVKSPQKTVFPVFKVVASVVLLLSVSVGGWLLVDSFSDEGSPATITPSPIYNDLDSLEILRDSIEISDKKDTLLLEIE